MIYLATPYAHDDEEVKLDRQRIACDLATGLIRQGLPIFCPIAYGKMIRETMPAAQHWSHETWMKLDLQFLAKSDMLLVATMPGWDKSKGVTEEIEFAKRYGIPIAFLQYETTASLRGEMPF